MEPSPETDSKGGVPLANSCEGSASLVPSPHTLDQCLSAHDCTRADTAIANILETQDRIPEAQQKYESILAQSPRAIIAANNLAWLYAEHHGNLDVALGLAQTAVQQAPDRPEVNETLGWIYYKRGLLVQAIGALQRSVQSAPAHPVYHYHLGLAYVKSGEWSKAKQSLQRGLTQRHPRRVQ